MEEPIWTMGPSRPTDPPSQQCLGPGRKRPPFEPLFRLIHHPDIGQGHDAREHTETQVEPEFPVAHERELLDQAERRFRAQSRLYHGSGRHRRDHHQAKGTRGEAIQDHLHRKEHTGDGCVERAANGCARARRHEDANLAGPHSRDLAHRAADGGTDLDDGTLAPHGSARTDGECGRQGLHDGNTRTDAPPALSHGELDFRDAMPLRLRSPLTDHPRHHDHADGRRKHERDPRGQRSQDVGKAATLIEEQPLRSGDQPPEPDGAQPGEQADRGGQRQRSGSGGAAQLAS